MVLNGITSFKEIEHDLVYGFRNRILQSNNALVSELVAAFITLHV